MKTERTNWDTEETAGSEAYRRRRQKRLDRMGSESSRRGRTLRGDEPRSVREGQFYSPEEQAEQQDYQFDRGADLAKQHEKNLERVGPMGSGEASFSAGDAAKALASRRRRNIETVGGRDRYRR